MKFLYWFPNTICIAIPIQIVRCPKPLSGGTGAGQEKIFLIDFVDAVELVSLSQDFLGGAVLVLYDNPSVRLGLLFPKKLGLTSVNRADNDGLLELIVSGLVQVESKGIAV